MNELFEVNKAVIWDSECVEFMKDGMNISEPVLSIVDNIVIDNYFTFTSNYNRTVISSPIKIFGIDCNKAKMIYVRDYPDQKYNQKNSIDISILTKEMYDSFSDIYGILRCAFETGKIDCTEDILEYSRLLEMMSGKLLYEYYKEVFPSFFSI